jgi:hypothetical protein
MVRVALLVIFALAGAACAEKVCAPGTAKDCICPRGVGQMRCTADGTAWQACECSAAPKTAEVDKGEITQIVRAEELGPADQKTNPNQKTVRITFRVSGPLLGEPTLTLGNGSKVTARSEPGLDPKASEQARVFLVPNDARDLRLGVGPNDPGQAVGELVSVPAADRFRERQIREHK